MRLLCLTVLVCYFYSAATSRSWIDAPIHTSIPTVNTLVGRGGSCRSRLSFLGAAAEAVDVALADKDVLICVMQLVDNDMHTIDSLLESLKVRRYRHDVLVQGLYFKFMVC